MCDQQKLRPACAYAQSDQSLCYSLEYSMSVKLLTEHHLGCLSLNGGCTGSSESTLVKISHCWKLHDTAHMYVRNGPLLHDSRYIIGYKIICNDPFFKFKHTDAHFSVTAWSVYYFNAIVVLLAFFQNQILQ